MDRKQKIEYLRRLAAGHLAPGDLLQLLPKEPGAWLQGKDRVQGIKTQKIDSKTVYSYE